MELSVFKNYNMCFEKIHIFIFVIMGELVVKIKSKVIVIDAAHVTQNETGPAVVVQFYCK